MKVKKAIASFLAFLICTSMVAQPVFAVSPPKNPTTTTPKLTTEQATERSRLGKIMREQSLVAQAEQEAHKALGKTPTVKLDVTSVLQNPELPNGCEITALSMLMLYSGGLYLNKTQIVTYLPTIPFSTLDGFHMGGNPEKEFCGNPAHIDEAFYCFENPIIEAGNKMIEEFNLDIKLEKLKDADETDLVSQLDNNRPVVVWTTVSNGEPIKFDPYGWVDVNSGLWTEPYLNLHTVLLTGYDDEYFYIADPMKGNIVAKRSTFMSAYEAMGSRAVVAK